MHRSDLVCLYDTVGLSWWELIIPIYIIYFKLSRELAKDFQETVDTSVSFAPYCYK